MSRSTEAVSLSSPTRKGLYGLERRDRDISRLGRVEVGDCLFLLAVVLYVLRNAIEQSYLSDLGIFQSMPDILFRLSVLLIVLKAVLFTRYSAGELIGIVFLMVCLLISWQRSGSWTVFMTGALVVGSVGVDYGTICKGGFVASVVAVAFVALLSQIGVISTTKLDVIESSANIFGVVSRNSFGFRHVNYLGLLIAVALLCRINLTHGQFSRKESALWLAVAAFCFFIANTKTVSFLIVLALVYCFGLRDSRQRSFYILCAVTVVACALLGFTLSYIYTPSNPMLAFVNDAFTGRFNSAHSFLQEYPVTLFGQELDLISTIDARMLGVSARVLDNAYVNLLLRYGLIPCCLLFVLFAMLLRRSALIGDSGSAFSTAILFFAGLSETWLFSLPGAIVLMGLFSKRSGSTLNSGSRHEAEEAGPCLR